LFDVIIIWFFCVERRVSIFRETQLQADSPSSFISLLADNKNQSYLITHNASSFLDKFRSLTMVLGQLSALSAFAAASIFSFQASAFELHMYTTKQCTGTATTEVTQVENGCSNFRGGSSSGIINRWSNETDNALLLATYSDETCCHANLIETFTWTAGCSELKDGVQGWRVLDPNEPDKGKEGDNYSC
jgi:hypothetical protein